MRNVCKRFSTPTTPDAPREMQTPSNYANRQCQKVAGVYPERSEGWRGRHARVLRRAYWFQTPKIGSK
jgi:hypothetical protein